MAGVHLGGVISFRDAWALTVFPCVKDDYMELRDAVPLRIQARLEKKGASEKKEKVAIQDKMDSVLEEVRKKSERRNAYLNLAWTEPIGNSRLQEDVSYEKVANVALDMFCDTAKTMSADSGGASAQAVSADADETENLGAPKDSALEAAAHFSKRAWRVPNAVEKGFEIPICITNSFAVPALGEFKRLGMDVVVNAVWLALSWARNENDEIVVSALKNLILDWPMDFILIQGDTPDMIQENMFLWAVNSTAKIERLRDFFGLENANLMRIVAQAADFVKAKLVNGEKTNAIVVQTWLVDNVRWGVFQCPDVLTVERHLTNWAAINKCPRSAKLVESAVQRWGRNNLLDWPTKLQIIVGKTDSSSIAYVVEALYAIMWRRNLPDPYGAAELKRVIAEILWVRTYMKKMQQQCPELVKSPSDATGGSVKSQVPLAKRCLDSPLALFMQTESPDRDPTWVQALPNEALRLFMKHAMDLHQGFYSPEIKGALVAVAADRYSPERFNKTTRVHQKFHAQFSVSYESLKAALASSGEAAATVESATAVTGTSASQDNAGAAAVVESAASLKNFDLDNFRKECEIYCKCELEARLLSMVASGTYLEIRASVTNTRLYANLTEEAPCMAFYDVKNAKLCSIYEHEGCRVSNMFFELTYLCMFRKSLIECLLQARSSERGVPLCGTLRAQFVSCRELGNARSLSPV